MAIEKFTNALWKLQIIGWFIYFLLMFFSFLTRETDETIAYIFLVKSFRTLVGFSLSCALWLIYRKVVKHYSIAKISILAGFLSVFFGTVWTAVETFFFMFTLDNYNLDASLQYKPRVALTYAVTLLAWSAIYFGIMYWRQVQKEHRNALEAKVLAETAQLEMLRYQLNPHFLFNALNSIRASINTEDCTSKQMITQLSEFLRHSLMSNDRDLNPLSDEIEAIENYLAIEKIRFEEALEVEFDIQEQAMQHMLPCFLLNPLVENAIKHGFQSATEVLKIKISAWVDESGKLTIKIANTGCLRIQPNEQDTSLGLKNVRERLDKQLPGKSLFVLEEINGLVAATIEIFPNEI